MEIMVVGGNFRGKGAEAMLLTVIQELAARIPGVRFSVLTGDKEPIPQDSVASVKDVPVSFVHAPPRSFADLAFWGLRWLFLVDRWSRLRQYSQFASRAVAVVDISGYSFRPRGRFPGRTALNPFTKLTLSRRAGAQHILLPQVMGPINGRLDRSLARRALLSATSITVRDQVTWAILDQLGVTAAKSVDVCPDIAFLFAPGSRSRAQEILRDVGIGDSAFLAITPNIRVYESSPLQDGKNVYLETLVRLVQDIVAKLQIPVLMIPHEWSRGSKDDAWLMDQILTRLEDRKQVFALRNRPSAADTKAVIGCAHLLVGSRYHSLIAALSMRVPCMAISWSHKYETLMETVELGESVCHANDLDYHVLWEKTLDLWNARDELVPRIDRAVSRFELEVSHLFDQVATVIQSASDKQRRAGDV